MTDIGQPFYFVIAFGVIITIAEAVLFHRGSTLGILIVTGSMILYSVFLLADWGSEDLTPEESEARLKVTFPLVWFRLYGFEEFKNLYDLFEEPDLIDGG